MDRIRNKGEQVGKLSVNDPSMKRKKLIIRVSLLDFIIINGVLLYTAYILGPEFQSIFIVVLPVLNVAIALEYIFLSYALGKGFDPITVYSNGIQFPERAFLRMIRRPSFVRSGEITSIRAHDYSGSGRSNELAGHKYLSLTTRRGKQYDTGPRLSSEIDPTIEWMETNWGLNIRNQGPWRVAPATIQAPEHEHHATKIPVPFAPRYCPNCGKECDYSLNFCTSCGRMLDQDVAQRTVVQETPSVPPAPVQDPYAGVAPQPYYTPPQYGVPPAKYQIGPDGKNPRKALIFALVFGFLGFMGIGHFYMGKTAKGIVLFLVGGFLAVTSLAAFVVVLTDTEGFSIAGIVAALVLSAPFLLIQIWQVFDAPKPKKNNDTGYNRP
ncbi:MAG: hypothetical protein LUQ09_07295 [Methanomassiliicoccales archaeon]|nr:hypothetical protein [Methanomassiliicoccales archaeon]